MHLLLAAFGWGLRHGVDIDHLAAIGDLSAGSTHRRHALALSSWYAAGHAAVLLVLGGAAIVAGAAIPAGLDAAMGRLVGVTLIALGGWTLWSVRTGGPDFRLRSRWALVMAWRRPPLEEVEITHEHPHTHDPHGTGHAHTHPEVAVEEARSGHHRRDATSSTVVGHSHVHTHRAVVPAGAPTRRAAVGVGVLHGVGAETPTQITVLAAAAGAAGTAAGLAYLLAFVAGLVAANTAVAAGFASGVMDPQRHPLAHRSLGIAVGGASMAIGAAMLLGD